MKVDLHTGAHAWIGALDKERIDGWGGVQTVDPSGRIWYYLAYPLNYYWFEEITGEREREIIGSDGWRVESWDTWRGVTFFTLTNPDHGFIKRAVDIVSLKEIPIIHNNIDDHLFQDLIRVDLHHRGDPSRDALYVNPISSTFYRRPSGTDRLIRLGTFQLGRFSLMGFQNVVQDHAIIWHNSSLGEIVVLGLTPTDDLVLWQTGQKKWIIVHLEDGSVESVESKQSHLSAADITSLVAGSDGFLYGGALYTMSNIVRFDPRKQEKTLLEGAIPGGEGQVNSLFNGNDGMIYGTGYPGAVPFRYNPFALWNPGDGIENNPLNLGPIESGNQMRSYRGIQDMDGFVWFESVADESNNKSHALTRADFGRRLSITKTDVQDDFPVVSDLAVFDSSHVILLGVRGHQPALFLVDQRKFQLVNENNLGLSGGVLFNLKPGKTTTSNLFLAQKRTVFRIHQDLSLEKVYRVHGDIIRAVPVDSSSVMLLSKSGVELLNVRNGNSEIWWNRHQGTLFRHLSWTPAAWLDGALFYANEEKLLCLRRR